jgi:hypothetical protein
MALLPSVFRNHRCFRNNTSFAPSATNRPGGAAVTAPAEFVSKNNDDRRPELTPASPPIRSTALRTMVRPMPPADIGRTFGQFPDALATVLSQRAGNDFSRSVGSAMMRARRIPGPLRREAPRAPRRVPPSRVTVPLVPAFFHGKTVAVMRSASRCESASVPLPSVGTASVTF